MEEDIYTRVIKQDLIELFVRLDVAGAETAFVILMSYLVDDG